MRGSPEVDEDAMFTRISEVVPHEVVPHVEIEWEAENNKRNTNQSKPNQHNKPMQQANPTQSTSWTLQRTLQTEKQHFNDVLEKKTKKVIKSNKKLFRVMKSYKKLFPSYKKL